MERQDPSELTAWADLGPDRQLALRTAYAAAPACLTGTCSLEAKTAHSAVWLAERGVTLTDEDLHPGRQR